MTASVKFIVTDEELQKLKEKDKIDLMYPTELFRAAKIIQTRADRYLLANKDLHIEWRAFVHRYPRRIANGYENTMRMYLKR